MADPTPIDRSAVTDSRVQRVLSAMDGILVAHDEAAVERDFHPDFVQHNPWAKDGAAHVKEMCAFEFGVHVQRYVVQGDLVAYHGIYTAPNPLGDQPLHCVDVWRVQGEQIVEHWDALQPIPAEAVGAFLDGDGDGGAAVSPQVVAGNAARVRGFLEGTATDTLAGDVVWHRPGGGSAEALQAWQSEHTVEIRRTIASGDSVLAQLDTRVGTQRKVVYAWFRLHANRIEEVWMVTQDFVPDAEAATAHPHF